MKNSASFRKILVPGLTLLSCLSASVFTSVAALPTLAFGQVEPFVQKVIEQNQTYIDKYVMENNLNMLRRYKEGYISVDGIKYDPKVGELAKLEEGGRVLQVTGKSSMLVTVFRGRSIGPGFPGRSEKTWVFSVKDFDTSGIVDGQPIKLGVVKVTGTETYDTESGSNTVFTITPFDKTKITSALKITIPAPVVYKRPPLPVFGYKIRTWSTPDGKFSINAKFLSADETRVRLKTENGKTIAVDKSRLADTDLNYLKTKKKIRLN